MNNVTKILVHHLICQPHLADIPISAKELISKLITNHSNHLLVMALAAAALDNADWKEIEDTLEKISKGKG